MQPSFVDPSIWALSCAATAFSGPATDEPRASFDLFNAPAEQLEGLLNLGLFDEGIKIPEWYADPCVVQLTKC